MANNLTTQTAVSTIPADTVIATDERDGVHYQVVKVAFGEDDAAFLISTERPLPVFSHDPTFADGVQPYLLVSASGINATVVISSGALVYSVQVFNTNAAPRYIKFFDLPSEPVPGDDEPIKTLLIPGSTSGAGLVLSWPKGLNFNDGVAFVLTTGVAPDDIGDVAADEIVVNIDYIEITW